MSTSTERPLGVVEAMTAARDQCPNAAVREYARRALEEVRGGGTPALREWAGLLLTTLTGWRGTRAEAVKLALHTFLSDSGSDAASGVDSDSDGSP